MKSLRVLIATALLFQLAAPTTWAGPESDARSYVENSKEAARDQARIIFHDFLQQSVVESTKVLSYSEDFVEKNQKISDELASLENLRKKLAIAAEDAKQVQDTSAVDQILSRLENSYRAMSSAYEAARTSETLRDQNILNAVEKENQIAGAYNSFLQNIEQTCSVGIAANFEYPDLPKIRPSVPQYSAGFKIVMNESGQTTVEPEIPSVQTEKVKGDAAAALYTTAYAGGFVLGAYVATGHLVLTSAAAATLTSSQYLAAASMGLGVAAAVAVAIYIDGLLDAIEKSHEVTNAMWIVHNGKADAETVRSEFKNICRPFAERIPSIRSRVTAVLKEDAGAIEDLNQERAAVQKKQDELMALQTLVNDKYAAILAELSKNENMMKLTQEQRVEYATKELMATPAYANLKEFIKSAKSDFLFNMLEVSLIDIGTHAGEIEKVMSAQTESLFKRQAGAHLNQLVSIAMLGRRLAIPAEVKAAVQAEVQANIRIAKLFQQFDLAFANYVQSQLVVGQSLDSLKQISDWLNDVKKAKADLPDSPTLKVLETRGQAFVKFLQSRGQS